jgi:cytoskeletal protein RodZ
VKTRIQSLSFLATLAVVMGLISWGNALQAQTTPATPSDSQQPQAQPMPDTPPTQQAPQTQTQTPSTPDSSPAAQQPSAPTSPSSSSQTPDQAVAPSADSSKPSANQTKTFSGTVVKVGEKYVLKDDQGHSYDIDHQDEVKKYEGKHISVQGTLNGEGAIKIQ